MLAHLRLAIRTLSKTPFVTAVAVGSMALGQRRAPGRRGARRLDGARCSVPGRLVA